MDLNFCKFILLVGFVDFFELSVEIIKSNRYTGQGKYLNIQMLWIGILFIEPISELSKQENDNTHLNRNIHQG